MKKNYVGTLYSDLLSKYRKFSSRLQKSIASGAFWKLSMQKRQAILARIEKFRSRLATMNPKLAGAMVATGFILTSGGAMAQANFVQQTGTNNPANAVVLSTSGYGAPTFADLDNDGDKDMIIADGSYYGPDTLQYFKNTGTASAAVFTEQTGTNNPFAAPFSLNGQYYTVPTFGDIDGDGDLDLLTGHDGDMLQFFRNTGTNTSPVFTLETGTTFPSINTISGNYYDELAPSFVDIDGDGDLDVMLGNEDIQSMVMLKNNGTASAPSFSFVGATDTNNPFAAVNPVHATYARVEPGFGDIDKDGDIDAWIAGDVTVKYFVNNGTTTAPSFVLGTTNPFSAFVANGYSYASFVDIDADSDKDYFVGSGSGISFYLNTDPTATSIETNDLSNSISVFPNPADNNLTISIENNQMANAQITLFDLRGAEVMKFQATNNMFTMNIADLAAGVYTLKITSEKNVAIKKIIKK